jgi:osmotically-inducible protein OsmY
MYALTVPDNPLRFPVIAEAARKCLRDSRYRAFGWISCECDDGVLLLRGRLSSFYLKQHAQEAVAGVEGVTQVVNEIEVD